MNDRQSTVLKTALAMLEHVQISDHDLVRSIESALGRSAVVDPGHPFRSATAEELQDLRDAMEWAQPEVQAARSAVVPHITQARLPIEDMELKVERRLADIDSSQLHQVRGLKSPRGLKCRLEQVDLEQAIKAAKAGGTVKIRYLAGSSQGHMREVEAAHLWVVLHMSPEPQGVEA